MSAVMNEEPVAHPSPTKMAATRKRAPDNDELIRRNESFKKKRFEENTASETQQSGEASQGQLIALDQPAESDANVTAMEEPSDTNPAESAASQPLSEQRKAERLESTLALINAALQTAKLFQEGSAYGCPSIGAGDLDRLRLLPPRDPVADLLRTVEDPAFRHAQGNFIAALKFTSSSSAAKKQYNDIRKIYLEYHPESTLLSYAQIESRLNELLLVVIENYSKISGADLVKFSAT